MILRTLALRTTDAARLCWIAMLRARYRYAVASRLAVRREAAAHVPRTALTIMERRIPATVNTIIISMNVKPAMRYRRGVEGPCTNASRFNGDTISRIAVIRCLSSIYDTPRREGAIWGKPKNHGTGEHPRAGAAYRAL